MRIQSFFWLLLPSSAILGVGLLVLSSVAPDFFRQQFFFSILFFLCFLLFKNIDLEYLVRFKKFFYLFFVTLLLITFAFGKYARGSVRWLNFGIFNVQISEIVKPFFAIMLSSHLAKIKSLNFTNLGKSFLIFLPFFVLVLKQPDLGNALVLLLMFTFVFFRSGVSKWVLLASLMLIVFILPVFFNSLAVYQKLRLINFLVPGFDPYGVGFHSKQAIIAVGSGGFFGKGLGLGTQSHLNFLPESHTDFIFASLAEELGFVGVIFLLTLYLILLLRIIFLAGFVEESFEKNFILGIFAMILSQTIINIGMNIGLFPITGITLPFVSYGGSSLVSMGISLGLLSSLRNKSLRRDPKIIF